MKRLSWKYIAGFVDGEGCVDVAQSKHTLVDGTVKYYQRPRVRVALSEPGWEVLELLHNNFGGNVFEKNRTIDNPNWSKARYWQIEGKRSRAFLQNIVNHTIIKKEQIKFTIWIIDNVVGKHVSKEVRQALKDELSAMKRDPQRLSEEAVKRVESLMR